MNFKDEYEDIELLFDQIQQYFNDKVGQNLKVENGKMVLFDARLDPDEMEYILTFSVGDKRINYLNIYITLYSLDSSLGLEHVRMIDKEIVSNVYSKSVRTDYDIVEYIKEQVSITLDQLENKPNFDLEWE